MTLTSLRATAGLPNELRPKVLWKSSIAAVEKFRRCIFTTLNVAFDAPVVGSL